MIGKDKPLIVIAGPTAVGKTRLALELAAAMDGEIISADSRQVYRYMDIGTAKPTLQERSHLPHHLIDVVNPDENLTLAEYQRMTYQAIDDVHHCRRVPVLVGGTGQYISAVVEGWSIPEVPPNDALRAELEAYAAEQGSAALFARLKAVDSDAAVRIEHHQNVRRVVRALEVYMETGQPISHLQRKQPPPYQMLRIVLTMERERLYQQADRRVDAMMVAGFLDEVRTLLATGYDRRLPSMSGLGYAQLAAHLMDGVPLLAAVEDTKMATRNFIRQQLTWFRKYNADDVWHNVEQITSEQIVAEALYWLNTLEG